MSKVTPIDKEFHYEGSVTISQTDLNGKLTFVNRKFLKLNDYRIDEVLGSDHNLTMHPDMPKAVYTKMWETIRGGQAWNGIIKNLRKDGQYYWLNLEVLPNKEEDEAISGFISVGKPASDKDIQESKELYEKMLQTQA